MSDSLIGFPTAAPSRPSRELKWVDVAVTPTGKEFSGFYRGKQYHERDFDAVLERAVRANVKKIMLTGMSLHDIPLMLDIAHAHPDLCSFTVGVHPYNAEEPEEDPDYFNKLVKSINGIYVDEPGLIKAYGELGLDYDRTNYAAKDSQVRTFKAQLDLFVAQGYDLPLFLHARNAFDDFVATIKPYLSKLPRGGLVHSFVGTAEQMRTLVALGLDISVNGFSFRDNITLQMVSEVPLDKLQVETDAPWGEITAGTEVAKRYWKNAPPMPQRKKRDKFELGYMVKERNESNMIDRVAYIVAGLRATTVEEIARASWKNSNRMFKLTDEEF